MCLLPESGFHRTSHGDVTQTPKDYSCSSFLHGHISLCHVVFAIRASHKLSWGGSQESSVCLRFYSPRDEYLIGYGNIGRGYPSKWRCSLVASLECWANPRKVGSPYDHVLFLPQRNMQCPFKGKKPTKFNLTFKACAGRDLEMGTVRTGPGHHVR